MNRATVLEPVENANVFIDQVYSSPRLIVRCVAPFVVLDERFKCVAIYFVFL